MSLGDHKSEVRGLEKSQLERVMQSGACLTAVPNA